MKKVTDEQIIVSLLECGTIKEAAARLGISPRTIYDRMKDIEFKAAYSEAKTDIVRVAVFNINNRLVQAIDAVADIMTDKENNAAVRLQAAQTIIANAGRFSDRLNNIEAYNSAMQRHMMNFEVIEEC